MRLQHRGLVHAGLLVLSTFVLAGCGSDEEDDEKFSEHHAINELNASYGAFADDGRLRVFAALLGKKGFVRLRGGDTIEVTVDGARVPTTERLLDDKVHYIADVPAPKGETEVAIAFVRGVDKVVGTIKLYSAFDFVAPPTTLTLVGSVPIDIDPRPDLSKWPGFFGPSLVAKAEVVGECLETGSQQIELCAADSAPGKCTQGYPLSLDATKLFTLPGTKSCPVSVQVRLTSGAKPFEAFGPAKTSFKGGGFEGHRVRALPLTLGE